MWVSVKNTFLDTEFLDMQSSPHKNRRAKSMGPGGCRGIQVSLPEQAVIDDLNGWDSEQFCNGYSAGDRAKWVFENCGASLGKARLKVMQEFPSQFGCQLHRNGMTEEPATKLASGQDLEPAYISLAEAEPTIMRSRPNSSLSTILEDWDSEEFLDGHSAQDRATWVVEHRGLSLEKARLRVMREFPAKFGRRRYRHGTWDKQIEEQVSGDICDFGTSVSEEVPVMQRSFSSSSLSTACPDDWDNEEFCDGHCAGDRAKWVVDNHGLPLEEAQLWVMGEFPMHFGRQRRENTSVNTLSDDSEREAYVVSVERSRASFRSPAQAFSSGHVPPKVSNLAQEFSKGTDEVSPTTMMLRNLPNRYTQNELIEELEALGFAGTFDFFYAPIDFGSLGNVGYAFINFNKPEWASHFQKDLDGYAFKKHQQKKRQKLATVSVAHLQGLQANLHHYEKAAVTGRARSKRWGPVIMRPITASATCS